MGSETNKPLLKIVKDATKPASKKPGNTGGNGSGGSGSSTKLLKFGDYAIKNGAFHQIKAVRAGPEGDGFVEFPLCDFTCKIVEEIVQDTGLEDSSFLRIEGRRADNVPLPLVDVPAKNFYSSQGNWVNEFWGAAPFIYPGAAKKDNLRAAIHLYSRLNGDVPRRVIYKFSGWKKINDLWHYLTGSGAITAAGLVDTVETDLGSGHMTRYALPAPLAGDELKAAINEALQLMTICPNKPHIGAVLLAAVARAPLGEHHPIDFCLWIHGLTGSRKSELAALCLAFFGDFNARRFPANWSDTDNALESKAFQCKDSLYIVDDFKPSVNQAEAAKLHSKAERFIRNTGNQAGRNRLSSSLQAIPAPYNRSMTIATGEDLPKGQSLLGRLLVLELARNDVDNNQLTLCQQSAAAGKFAGLMSAYIQWLAPRMDQLKQDFPKFVQQYRDKATQDGLATSHPRAPELYANMVAGCETFTDFLQDAGISSERANVLTADIETGLKYAFSEQGAYQKDQDEIERFLQLLRASLSSGNGHIATATKQGPPITRPYSWGWRGFGKDLNGDDEYRPMGDSIGWYAEPKDARPAEVWLEPNTTFKVVQEFARRQGDSFLISPASLWRRMSERGILLRAEANQTTVKRVVAGRSVRVLTLSADLIESG